MSRNILAASDAINRAKGINAGLDALVSLLMASNEADVPPGKSLAELLLSIQKDLEKTLSSADQMLQP